MKKILFLSLMLLFTNTSYGDSIYNCPPATFKNFGCNSNIVFESTKEECDTCSGRVYENGLCIKENSSGRFVGNVECGYSAYFNCDFIIGVGASEEECNKCPNRKMDGVWCRLKECPLGYFSQYEHTLSDCISCDEVHAVRRYSSECLKKCPNREIGGIHNRCVLKECPENHIKDVYGNCIYCSEKIRHPIRTTTEECSKCEYLKFMGEDLCTPISRQDNSFWFYNEAYTHDWSSSEFYNISCDRDVCVKTTQEECALCKDRYYSNGYCLLRNSQFKNCENKITFLHVVE